MAEEDYKGKIGTHAQVNSQKQNEWPKAWERESVAVQPPDQTLSQSSLWWWKVGEGIYSENIDPSVSLHIGAERRGSWHGVCSSHLHSTCHIYTQYPQTSQVRIMVIQGHSILGSVSKCKIGRNCLFELHSIRAKSSRSSTQKCMWYPQTISQHQENFWIQRARFLFHIHTTSMEFMIIIVMGWCGYWVVWNGSK